MAAVSLPLSAGTSAKSALYLCGVTTKKSKNRHNIYIYIYIYEIYIYIYTRTSSTYAFSTKNERTNDTSSR